MTVTFIKLVYGVPSVEANDNFFTEEDECREFVEGLESTGLSEDDDELYQVYHIAKEYLTDIGKELVESFENNYDISFFVDPSCIHIEKGSNYSWIQEDIRLHLENLGINLSKFRWLYVVSQW